MDATAPTALPRPASAGIRAPWPRFAASFAVTATVALALLVGLIALIDPYDTGRSPLFGDRGVREQGPRTASAYRGRDPAFRGAVFGNSHMILVKPEALQAATGVPFVQLSVPATLHREQIALLRWFMRHHRDSAQALVIGVDHAWCTLDSKLPLTHAFPFWLVSESAWDYARGLLRLDALEEVQRRIAFLLNPKRKARADGYWDFDAELAAARMDEPHPLVENIDAAPPPESAFFSPGPFPAVEELLAPTLAGLPPPLPVVIVHPPVYAPFLPRPGGPAARTDAACKEAVARLAAARPRTAVVDWRVDRPETRDRAQFFDRSHYRQPVARLIEADIVAALARLRGPGVP